jgi:hypothetical protein
VIDAASDATIGPLFPLGISVAMIAALAAGPAFAVGVVQISFASATPADEPAERAVLRG